MHGATKGRRTGKPGVMACVSAYLGEGVAEADVLVLIRELRVGARLAGRLARLLHTSCGIEHAILHHLAHRLLVPVSELLVREVSRRGSQLLLVLLCERPAPTLLKLLGGLHESRLLALGSASRAGWRVKMRRHEEARSCMGCR